jgi:hypothetical protein
MLTIQHVHRRCRDAERSNDADNRDAAFQLQQGIAPQAGLAHCGWA